MLMANDNDMEVREAARRICVEQASKQDNDEWVHFASGARDSTVWMRLVEQGIRAGLQIARSQT
jgi:hypothetical protein